MNSAVKNWALFIVAAALVVAGVVAFYHFNESPIALRILMVLAGVVLGAGVAYTSEPGHQFVRFAKEALDEGKKVAWPTRKETVQMTLIVFAFAVVMSIFLFSVDTLIGILISWLTNRG